MYTPSWNTTCQLFSSLVDWLSVFQQRCTTGGLGSWCFKPRSCAVRSRVFQTDHVNSFAWSFLERQQTLNITNVLILLQMYMHFVDLSLEFCFHSPTHPPLYWLMYLWCICKIRNEGALIWKGQASGESRLKHKVSKQNTFMTDKKLFLRQFQNPSVYTVLSMTIQLLCHFLLTCIVHLSVKHPLLTFEHDRKQ